MKMLSLFSGVGMIDLAASWAGIETVAFCEIEEYPQKIIAKEVSKCADLQRYQRTHGRKT